MTGEDSIVYSGRLSQGLYSILLIKQVGEDSLKKILLKIGRNDK